MLTVGCACACAVLRETDGPVNLKADQCPARVDAGTTANAMVSPKVPPADVFAFGTMDLEAMQAMC